MFAPKFELTAGIASALMRIEACRRAIDDASIDTTLLRHLRETAALDATHYSTRIEGNRLTFRQVREAIRGARMPGRKRDERNHYLPFGPIGTWTICVDGCLYKR